MNDPIAQKCKFCHKKTYFTSDMTGPVCAGCYGQAFFLYRDYSQTQTIPRPVVIHNDFSPPNPNITVGRKP